MGISTSTVRKINNLSFWANNPNWDRTDLYVPVWAKRAEIADFPVASPHIFTYCDACIAPMNHGYGGLCEECDAWEEEGQNIRDTYAMAEAAIWR